MLMRYQIKDLINLKIWVALSRTEGINQFLNFAYLTSLLGVSRK